MNTFTFVTRYLLYSQFLVTPPLPTESFDGQVVVVTGANSGIGYECVKHLIRLNASKIILAVRSHARGQAAVESIVKDTGCDLERLEVWPFDLASRDSIQHFVARAECLERLDAVIQNAGVDNAEGLIDGNEATAWINTLAPLYFGYLILPKMKSSAEKTGLKGRLTFNGSDVMYSADLTAISDVQGSLLDTMNDPEMREGPFALSFSRYILTKTLLFYSVRFMASQHPLTPTSNVVINDVTPGMTLSGFGENRDKPLSAPIKWIKTTLLSLIARRTDVGARTLIHAVEPSIDSAAHGKFLMDSQIVNDNPVLQHPKSQAVEERWVQEAVQYLEKIHPGITQNR